MFTAAAAAAAAAATAAAMFPWDCDVNCCGGNDAEVGEDWWWPGWLGWKWADHQVPGITEIPLVEPSVESFPLLLLRVNPLRIVFSRGSARLTST